MTWKRSHDAQLKQWEAGNKPCLAVSMKKIAYFPTSGKTLEEGVNPLLDHPPMDEAPVAMLQFDIKNVGQVAVNVDQVGIRLARINKFLCFRNGDERKCLDADSSVRAIIHPSQVTEMLELLDADDRDYFTVDVVDAVDRHYSSEPYRAAVHLKTLETFRAIAKIKPRITQSPITEEEEGDFHLEDTIRS